MTSRVFVGNLPFATTESQLIELFSQTGSVVAAKISMDKHTGRPRGFGFVSLSTDAEAREAIARFDGEPFGGRRLTVREAHAHPEPPAGS